MRRKREGQGGRKFFKGKRNFKGRKFSSTSDSVMTHYFFFLSFPKFLDLIHENQCKGIWWKLKILVENYEVETL